MSLVLLPLRRISGKLNFIKIRTINPQLSIISTMAKNYYEGLSADYPRPGLVSAGQSALLLKQAEDIIKLKEDVLPEISADYTPAQIEAENKAWPPVSGKLSPLSLVNPGA